MAMIFWDTLDAASDQTMSTIVDTSGTRTRQSIINLISPIAAGIIAGNPTVIAAASAAAESAVARALDEENIVRAFPEGVVTQTGQASVPMRWRYKTMASTYPTAYTDTYEGTWEDGGPRRGDIPIIQPGTGALRDSVIPATVARLTDIPTIPDNPGTSVEVPERAVSRSVPLFAARFAAHRAALGPCAVVLAGSSTTARSPGFVGPLTSHLQQLYAVSSQSDPQWSTTAEFTRRTSAGVHVYSAGRSNTTAATYLTDEISDRIATLNPAVIQHMVGSNDFRQGQSPETYRSRMISRLDYLDNALTQPTQHVLAHQFERMDAGSVQAEWSEFGAVLAEIAASRPNAVFIDLTEPFALTGIPATDPLDLIGTDDIHLTSAGYRLLADQLSTLYIA